MRLSSEDSKLLKASAEMIQETLRTPSDPAYPIKISSKLHQVFVDLIASEVLF